MIGYDGTSYFQDLLNIIGQTFNFLLTVPLFRWGQATITVGSMIIYSSIVIAILRFAINLPGSGITLWKKGK